MKVGPIKIPLSGGADGPGVRPTASTDGRSRVYGTLDGMRGVAAIAVVVLHAAALFGPIRAPSAGLAVDLFFVMSGFIIAHAYEAKMRNGLSRGRFIVLRLIRLYPLYLLGLGLGVVEATFELAFGRTQAWTAPSIFSALVFNLPMLPTPTGGGATGSIFPFNPPGWSLFFELFINIAYALFLPRLSNRALAMVIAVSGLALIVLGLDHGDLHFGSDWDNFLGGFPRVAFSFSAGLLIYRQRERWASLRTPPLLLLVICGALFAIQPGKAAAFYELGCVLIAMPALVMLGSATEPGPRLWPFFRFLGLTSYAVYSLHYPLALATQGVVRRLLATHTASAQPWIGLAFLALLLAACAAIDALYDSPVRRRLTRLDFRRPKPADPSVAK